MKVIKTIKPDIYGVFDFLINLFLRNGAITIKIMMINCTASLKIGTLEHKDDDNNNNKN